MSAAGSDTLCLGLYLACYLLDSEALCFAQGDNFLRIGYEHE